MAPSNLSRKAVGLQRRATSRLLQSWSGEEASSLPRLFSGLLRLASSLYIQGLARDQRKARSRSRKLPVFVISVGNLVVGGTGKTPVTLWIAEYLQQSGLRVAILSRGYGRNNA